VELEAVIRQAKGRSRYGPGRGGLLERGTTIDLTMRDETGDERDQATPAPAAETDDGSMRPHYAYGATRSGVRTVHLVLESEDVALCGTAVPSWLQTPFRPERVTVCSRCRVLRREGEIQ
jgi:hypothetical protein